MTNTHFAIKTQSKSEPRSFLHHLESKWTPAVRKRLEKCGRIVEVKKKTYGPGGPKSEDIDFNS